MSRVHDALRRAEKTGELAPPVVQPHAETRSAATPALATLETGANLAGLLELVEEVPFRTATDSLLIDAARPHEAPMEEFRTLRTRLNHMQSLQPIHTGSGHQRFAGGREVAYRGEPGFGRIALGRQYHAFGGLRFPPPADPYHVRNRSQPRHHGLLDGASAAA